MIWATLTVAEGKRLIAKGIMEQPQVKSAIANAAVVISRGSTNHYILEEFYGRSIENGLFQTGRILPKGRSARKINTKSAMKEQVFQNGELREMSDFSSDLKTLPAGSVIFKGGNLLNHDAGQVAVLASHPTKGTIGMINEVLSSKIKLIVPIGLEKNSSADLTFMGKHFPDKVGSVPGFHLMNGEPFTEIEAIECIADVQVYQFAAGGLDGAEGSVSLLVRGSKEEVEKAEKFISSVYGEPAFYSIANRISSRR